MISMTSSNKPNHYFYASIHVYIGGSATVTVIQTKSPSYSITVPFMPVKTKLLLKDFDQQ